MTAAIAQPTSARTRAHAPRFARPPNPFRIPDTLAILALRHQRRRPAPGELADFGATHSPYRQCCSVDCAPISPDDAALDRLILAPDSDPPPESLRRFVSRERELFHAQLTIDHTREELHRLSRLEAEEQQSLREKEAEIAHFQEQFRAFIDEEEQKMLDSRTAVESKAKERVRIAAKIKQISSQNARLRDAIAAHEEKLELWDQYKLFLERLTPPEWRAMHPPPEMYFRAPEQLVNLMAWLESQNMSLVHHCQDAEDIVERYLAQYGRMIQQRDGSISVREEELDKRKTAFRELKGITATTFHWGNELSDGEMYELQTAIFKLGAELGFDLAKSIDAVTMLTRIESVMEKLKVELENLDAATVREQMQQKITERQDAEKIARNLRQREEQNERTQQVIQKAMMKLKDRTGRPIRRRMLPILIQDREVADAIYRRKRDTAAADADLLYGDLWD
jgi:hypothetical protein